MSECSGTETMMIDGEEFTCKRCFDPGCPVHGLEAQVKAKVPYCICDNPEAKDANDMSSIDNLPHYMRRRKSTLKRVSNKVPVAF